MTRAGHERSLDLSPPAKRQRTLIICSSSDEDDSDQVVPCVGEQTATQAVSSLHLSTRSSNLGNSARAIAPGPSRSNVPTTNLKTTTTARPGSRAPSSSPEKAKKQNHKQPVHSRRPSKDVSPSKTRSLHNFFQPASEEQRWSSQKFETRPTTLGGHFRHIQGVDVAEEEDLIEDDYDSYDEIFTQQMNAGPGLTGSQATESAVTAGRPQQHRTQEPSSARALPILSGDLLKKRPVSASKRFLLTSTPQTGEADRQLPEVEGDDARPWAQRFAPVSLEELAVHKKKVADVKGWLDASFSGRNKQRLLVLRGPAGSGKTTTVSLLSRSVHFDVLEWRNPTVAEAALGGSGAQFEEFLGRGNKFSSLDLGGTVVSASETERGAPDVDSGRRILLIEEFPVLTSRNSAALAAFRSSLQRYLVDGFPSQQRPPVVMIVSETLLSSSSSTSDNLTAHRLLGPILYNHPATTVIEFNSIAPTFMVKALNLILEKEARGSKRTKVPGQAVLKAVSEIGDVRSAISALEFLCLKSEGGAQWSSPLAAKNKRAARTNKPLTSMEKESLELITQREASLGIFHAVGKVVYNKRDDAIIVDAIDIPPSPPEQLRRLHRPKVSQVSVNSLLDETGTDIQTFICALHENYAPSCDGASFAEHLDGCIEALSDSDILTAGHRRSPGTRSGPVAGLSLMGAAVDVLRQDEIAFHTAVRGLLFALPYPVKRHLPAAAKSLGGRTGGAHKMFYPALLRQWSDYEQAEGLIDLWMKRSLDPSSRPRLRSDGSTATAKPEGVRSWKSLKVGTIDSTDGDASQHDTAQSTAVTMLSREDMVLYQLPYFAHITHSDSERQELEKVIAFHGTQGSSELPDDDAMALDEDDDLPATEVYTDASEPIHQSPTKPRRVLKGQGSIHAFGPKLPPSIDEEEKLVLSDDDIED